MTNDTLNLIKQRRSIRKFTAEQISESDLQALLEAAILAPSAINQQKWHFTAVQDRGLLDVMVGIVKENILKTGIEFLVKRASMPGYDTFHHAPTIIMVSGDESARIDCGAAAENILIAAESLGLGSCIMTSPAFLFASDKGNGLRKRLGIPEGYNHICTIALGHKAETPEMPPRTRDVITYLR